jgi:hypothetical protein
MDWFCILFPVGLTTFLFFVAGVISLWEIKKELGRIAGALGADDED